MTRDEAINKIRVADGPPPGKLLKNGDWAIALVDSLVLLGALKLDEPQNIASLIEEAWHYRKPGGAVEVSVEQTATLVTLVGELAMALESIAFKTVEKHK